MSNKPNYTPGPWEVKPLRNTRLNRNSWVIQTSNDSFKQFITSTISIDVGDEQAYANAHLIAAAPKLLATLKLCERYFKGEIPTMNLSFVSEAIAKAEGKA